MQSIEVVWLELFGQLNPPSVPKPDGVVRRSQSFLQDDFRLIVLEEQAKKDFRSSRAASDSTQKSLSRFKTLTRIRIKKDYKSIGTGFSPFKNEVSNSALAKTYKSKKVYR